MSRQLLVGIATLSLASISGVREADGQSPPDDPPVHFTAEQADRGRTLYGETCAECHGRALDDGTAPPLAGEQFLATWGAPDKTLDDLFYILRTTMPDGDVGSLSEGEYLDVLAYVLERNGYKSGARELTADAATLGAARVEAHATAGDSEEEAPVFIRGERGLAPEGRGPTQEELNAADANARDWLYHTHGYSGTRYSALSEIDTGNVARLAPACIFQMGTTGPFQSGPIVYDGTMYVTTLNTTVALDAATCALRWQHEWEPRARVIGLNSRGVAIKDGRVIRTTSDGYLVALDAADGSLLWARRVADSAVGETLTMPPLIYGDLVVVGPAVSEFAIEGWIGAFKVENGERVWRFNNVPGAKDGTGTWPNPEGIVMGGGGVWTPLSLDPETGELYVAVTNPAPDFPAEMRPGDNLYTNSVVALDVRTGELRWYHQLVPNDAHDWDLTQVSPLFRTSVGGHERNLIATAGKDGFLRVLDRDTHERMYELPVTTIANTDVPLTREGVLVCPGIEGGVLWNGPAYSERTNLLYVGAVDWCGTFALADEVRFVSGQVYLGGSFRFEEEKGGRLTAVDASDGSVRWTYRSAWPVLGAVTATAGDVVFLGELTGDLLAFDARTGQELWRFHTGGPIGGGVVSYSVGGRQYVAVSSGDPSILNWRLEHLGSPTVLVFALPEG